MVLQYISDNQGHTTAVQLQIPIEDWKRMLQQYPELEAESLNSDSGVPDWQIELVKKELNLVAQGKSETSAWEDIKDTFSL